MRFLWSWFLPAALFSSTVFGQTDDQGFVDSSKAVSQFATELGKMHEAKKTTSIDQLYKQLKGEPRVRIDLDVRKGRRLKASALHKKCRAGTVMVGKLYKCGRCEHWHVSNASGFVIGANGIVVTNYHVVEKGEGEDATLGVRTWDEKIFPVQKILASDRKNDLAVLKIDARRLTALPVQGEVEVGEEVFAITHPVRHLYTLTKGVVSGKHLRTLRKGEKVRELNITADFAKGSSGGPIFNQKGEVVGIVRATTSVYYDKHDKHDIKTNLQMVWKQCIPALELLELLAEEKAPKAVEPESRPVKEKAPVEKPAPKKDDQGVEPK